MSVLAAKLSFQKSAFYIGGYVAPRQQIDLIRFSGREAKF